MILDYKDSFEQTRIAGALAAKALDEVTSHVNPGVTTYQLDKICTILFSPTFGKIDPAIITDWILKDNLPVRMQTGTGLYSLIEKMPLVFLGINKFEKSFFSLEINFFIWLITSFIILFSVFYCLNLEKIKKSKKHFLFCISFGILIINLIIPRLVVYDLILTVPILFYLLNQINFKKYQINEFKLKFFLIFLFLVFFDHHFPFLVIITFLTLFIYSEFYKKNIFIY